MRLEALLRPRTIAVLGASERPSIGRAIIESLPRLGYRGEVYPINPKYTELLGRRCYASISDLPVKPDVVAFCVGSARVLENFKLAAAHGISGAVIYDGGFAEQGSDGQRLQAEIVGLCREAGIALCGPNCMGILSPASGGSTYMQEIREPQGLRGNVGLVSQSGSICIGLLSDIRRYGYSHIVSSGNEAVVAMVDYLEFLIDDSDTKIIALFVETAREPDRLAAALDRAAERGKPVVVLKVGRTERAQRAVTTHTGGLAGDSHAFSAFLDAHGAIEVEDLDELTEVLAVCQGSRWPHGRRIGAVTASGGQAELILDVATRRSIDLPPLPPPSREEAARVIGPITGDGNPLDAWGNGNWAANFPHAFAVMDANPDCDTIVYCNDSYEGQPMGTPEDSVGYCKPLAAAAAKSTKPHLLMNMRPGMMSRDQVNFLRESGIAMIGGARQGLGAVDRIARWSIARAKRR
ncbi:MAG: CoA-binding protein [Alphaproteobacteria bacterium]